MCVENSVPTLCLSLSPKATLRASSTVSHTRALPQAKIKAFFIDGGSYLITSTTNFTFFGSRISLKKWYFHYFNYNITPFNMSHEYLWHCSQFWHTKTLSQLKLFLMTSVFCPIHLYRNKKFDQLFLRCHETKKNFLNFAINISMRNGDFKQSYIVTSAPLFPRPCY